MRSVLLGLRYVCSAAHCTNYCAYLNHWQEVTQRAVLEFQQILKAQLTPAALEKSDGLEALSRRVIANLTVHSSPPSPPCVLSSDRCVYI